MTERTVLELMADVAEWQFCETEDKWWKHIKGKIEKKLGGK